MNAHAIELIEPAEEALALEPRAPQQPAAPSGGRQLTVVEYAMQSGASAADVRALVELQIQMDQHKLAMRKQDDERERELRAEAARNAYASAMAAFKGEHVKVIRSKLITDGPLKGKKHADLFAVTDAATEALSKHGLSTSWETLEDSKDWIRIACRVKHVAGHSEAVPFGGPVDTGPGRNAIQARKSTITYLERFTMLMALGLAEQDADDDGAGSGDVHGDSRTEASDSGEQVLIDQGQAEAVEGMASLTRWWGSLNAKQRAKLSRAFAAMRRVAQNADQGVRHG